MQLYFFLREYFYHWKGRVADELHTVLMYILYNIGFCRDCSPITKH
jgi:hypothetical protein